MSFLGIDNSEIDKLAVDIAGAGVRATVRMVPVVTKGALNIKTEARELAPHGPRTRAYPHSITYDVNIRGASIEAEIGPDKGLPQGPLGNILEYGTATTAPQPHLQPAFDHEVPRFEEAAADVAAISVLR